MRAHHNVTVSVCAASCHSCSLFLLNRLNDQSFSTESGGNSAALSGGSAWGTPKPLLLWEKGHPGLSGDLLSGTTHTEEQTLQSMEPGCLRRPPTPSPQAPYPAVIPWSMHSLPPLAAITLGLQWTAAEPSLCPRPAERGKTHSK